MIRINQIETDDFDIRYALSGTGGGLKADGSIPLTADWDLGSHKITSLTNPTTAQGAATKKYVDDSVVGGSAIASITLEYKLYRSALKEAYIGYIDCHLVISENSDFSTPIINKYTAISQTSWLAYCAASASFEAWSASGMPSPDIRSIIYTGANLTRGIVYYYRWRTYKHGDSTTATDYKGGMICL